VPEEVSQNENTKSMRVAWTFSALCFRKKISRYNTFFQRSRHLECRNKLWIVGPSMY